MAQYNATLYKNTGFNTVDIPDSPALVETFTGVSAAVLYLKQNAPITSVKIQKAFNDIKNCDYMKIGNMFYFVTDITMLNDNVCEASVVEDSITSLGGPAVLSFIDGWCERKHVTTDYLFENIIPENFSPKDVMKLDTYSCGHLSDYTGAYTFIASTVDLSDPTWTDAEVYVGTASSGNYEVTVPSLPGKAMSTTIEIMPISGTSSYLSAQTPGYGLYDYSSNNVQLAVDKIRALGLETVLVGCYRIPSFLVDSITDLGGVGHINTLRMKAWDIGFKKVDDDIAGNSTGTLQYKYGTYTPANNKVFSQFNDVTVYSLSGDKMTYRMCDIKDDSTISTPGAGPGFKLVSNGAPNGKPYLRPQYFEGQGVNHVTAFDNAVQGSTWLNTPIVLEGASGSALNAANAEIQRESSNIAWNNFTHHWSENAAVRAADAIIGGIKTTAGGIKSTLKGDITDGVNAMYNLGKAGLEFENKEYQRANEGYALANSIQAQKLAYEISQNIVAPDVKFNQDMTLQMFLGNAFFAYTLRLSDADLERFDKYLTLYGYATSEPLTTACFTGRTNFNFVQASGVSIQKTTSVTYAENDNRMRRIMAAAQLAAGCRFWHVKPDASKRFTNPMASNNT